MLSIVTNVLLGGDVDNWTGSECMGAEGIWEIFILFTWSFCKPKTAQKNKTFF